MNVVAQVFERIFGYCAAEVVGRSSLELNIWQYPQDRQRMMSLLRSEGRVRDEERAEPQIAGRPGWGGSNDRRYPRHGGEGEDGEHEANRRAHELNGGGAQEMLVRAWACPNLGA